MLTQEQAWDLNIQQHALEAAELKQADAQKKIDSYLNAMNTITSSYDSLSPEKQAAVKGLLPKLQQGYNDAVAERNTAENSYWVANNKINEYNTLAAQQPVYNGGGQKRRTISTPIPTPIPTPIISETTNGGLDEGLETPTNTNNGGNVTLGGGTGGLGDNTNGGYITLKGYTGKIPNDVVYHNGLIYPLEYYKRMEPRTSSYQEGQAANIYNRYNEAGLSGGTIGQASYLRTLPNPFDIGYNSAVTNMKKRMMREGIPSWEADKFIADWIEANTP